MPDETEGFKLRRWSLGFSRRTYGALISASNTQREALEQLPSVSRNSKNLDDSGEYEVGI